MPSIDSGTNILALSNTQAKELAGRVVTIGTETYSFKNYDPKLPGQPPWRSARRAKPIRCSVMTTRSPRI